MKNTQPVFIVGSGRSGTRTFFRMLSGAEPLEIHHEYAVHETQKNAALYSMGRIGQDEVIEHLQHNHGAAIHYSDKPLWADSSNKLSWLIEPLHTLFPNAKFLAVVRDGRKVVSSFYYKLREEMYDERSTTLLGQWLQSPDIQPCPPPEKKYWWNIPQAGQAFHDVFPAFNRLQRTAYHWQASNAAILSAFEKIPAENQMLVRLEDIRKDSGLLAQTMNFIGLENDETYMEYLQTPRNVFFPLDFQLTKIQLTEFEAICRPMMDRLGYTAKETYRVTY